MIFNVFMNVATYLIFTLCCFYLARPPARLVQAINENVAGSRLGQRLPSIVRDAITVRQMSKTQTVAVCFCGAAKTQSLGIPLIAAMWTHADPLTMAYIEIPVVLYTMEQVFLAQGFVYFFKWYLRRDREVALDQGSSVAVEQELEERNSKLETSMIRRDTVIGKDTVV